MENFKMHVKCECQQRGCKYCDPKNEIPVHNFEEVYNGHCLRCGETFVTCAQQGCDKLMIPDPDWDEMKRDFDLRMESKYFYCLELKNSAGTYLAKTKGITRSIYKAERFFGKDGKFLADLYLYLNQSSGTLKNFIVTEHEFV